MNRKELMALPEAEMITEMEKLQYANMQNFETYSSSVKYAQETIPVESVVRCPYTHCGSSDIKVWKKMIGAKIYLCNTCNHLFKVLQEGDVYLWDVGREVWYGSHNLPSYFKEKYK